MVSLPFPFLQNVSVICLGMFGLDRVIMLEIRNLNKK